MKLLKKLVLFGIILGAALTTIYAGLIIQIENAAVSHILKSDILAEERPYNVYLPGDYEADTVTRYPVLYTVDGERVRNSSLAALTGKLVADRNFILVAIDMIGKRERDLKREGARAFNTDTAGRSDRFRDFIEQELIPEIDAAYRTTPERILAGHSYGGMFTIHTMSLRPHLFSGYLAFSPALNADDRSLPDLAQFLASDIAAEKALYMNLGWETMYEYDLRFDEARALIQQQKPPGFRFDSSNYWLIHGAVPIPGYFEGLSYYFAEGEREVAASN